MLEEMTHLWANNCGGQNKNKSIIWYLTWLVLQGMTNVMRLCFQIKGHTCNSVNCGFVTTKNKSYSTDIWCSFNYINLVNTSIATGKIHLVSFLDDPEGKKIRNWKTVFTLLMKPVDEIQKY